MPMTPPPAAERAGLLTVLVVDDNVRMQQLIGEVLGEVARSIYVCGDGEAAVALYRAVRPDWVSMDIAMPHMDGIAATRAIRAWDPSARIVIVSQIHDDSVRRAAWEAGATAVVPKDRLLDLPAALT